MTILYLIIFPIITGLIGGLLYSIYLPFKIRLLKSGKLTKRLSKRINLIYIAFLCLLTGLLFCFRDYRTPSKDRLEKIADVRLPHDFKVIKDEYQDMLQDYCIIFQIQMTVQGGKEFSNSIRNSRYFIKQSLQKKSENDSTHLKMSPASPEWIKTSNGYEFITPFDRQTYSITFDTIKNRIDYQECYD